MLVGGPLGLSLAPQIKSSFGGVYRALKPLANAYARACGYRKVGLKYDDLIMEEREDVQKALGRLTTRESYDRVFRMKVAFQQSVLHRELPKNQWITEDQDKRYLTPIVNQVSKENHERETWDNILVERKK